MDRTLTPAPDAEKWSDGLYGRYLILIEGRPESSVTRRVSGWYQVPNLRGEFNHPKQAAEAWWAKNEKRLQKKYERIVAGRDGWVSTRSRTPLDLPPGGRMTRYQNDWAPSERPLAPDGSPVERDDNEPVKPVHGPVLTGFQTSWTNLHGIDNTLPGKTWGIRVAQRIGGPRASTGGLSGRTVEVTNRAGKMSVVTLGRQVGATGLLGMNGTAYEVLR